MTRITTNDPYASPSYTCENCKEQVTEDEEGESCQSCWTDLWLEALQIIDKLVDEHDRLREAGKKPLARHGIDPALRILIARRAR